MLKTVFLSVILSLVIPYLHLKYILTSNKMIFCYNKNVEIKDIRTSKKVLITGTNIYWYILLIYFNKESLSKTILKKDDFIIINSFLINNEKLIKALIENKKE